MRNTAGPGGAQNELTGGRRRSLRTLCAACFVCALSAASPTRPAMAQPPRLNATGGKVQTIEHNGLSEPQVFPEVKWIIINPQGRRGAVVEMSCAAFANTLDASLRVDTRLDLRVIRSNQDADWSLLTRSDQTDIARGYDTAHAVALSNEHGNGQLGIVVTFVNSDFTQLTTGEYETVLVGTITEN